MITITLQLTEKTLKILLKRCELTGMSLEATLEDIIKTENNRYIARNKEFPLCKYCNKEIDPLANEIYEIKVQNYTKDKDSFKDVFHCELQRIHAFSNSLQNTKKNSLFYDEPAK